MEKESEYVIKSKNNTNQHQIFDNAFLSECVWHKRLLIPLINEIFNKNIPENAKIENLVNEEYRQGKSKNEKEKLIKRVTDALISVGNAKYHFECESKNNGEILIRISEYDMMIALNDAVYDKYTVDVVLPETAVVFLRKHRKLPDKGEIIYHKGNRVLKHTIPFLKVSNYTLEELAQKHLYMLFPFYLMRYEHAIKYTPDKYELIEKEAVRVYDSIINSKEHGHITEIECENIIVLCKDVVNEMSKNTDINGRLVSTMGNEILLTAEERGIEKGIEKGIITTLVDLVKDGLITITDAAKRAGKSEEEFSKLM